VTAALLGSQAMAMWPFTRRQPWRQRDDGNAGPEPGTVTLAPDYRERFERRTCRLCGTGAESVFHAACECGDARLAAARAVVAAATRRLLHEAWNDGRVVLLEAQEPPAAVAGGR
jgi:hypothetical protein